MPKKRLRVEVEHDVRTKRGRSQHFRIDREILIDHVGGVAIKETHHHRPNPIFQSADIPTTTSMEESGGARKSNHKNFSDLLCDLETEIPTFIHGYLNSQAPPPLNTACSGCGTLGPLFSCIDCAHAFYECQTCVVAYHRRHPLHRINEYTSTPTSQQTYVTRTSLDTLGLVYHLGHAGMRCPRSSVGDVKRYTVVHINGVHLLKITACACPGIANLLSQLASARFIPATTERPQTLFTYDVLEAFYHHTHESGATAYAFFEALRRITNDVFHSTVQDRYREFLRVTRIWRRIQDLLRSGQWLKINDLLPSTARNTVAVLCPACPQPDINLDLQYEQSPTPYINKFFGAIDGNFRQVLMKKQHDPRDYSLSEAQSYFVESDSYSDYLSNVTDVRELSTCTGFKAGDIMRQTRDRNLTVTGIVAVSCSRHNLVMPQSIVDLFKGERYSNVDFAVSSALRKYIPTTIPIELSYDIACKYHINFEKRMKCHFPHMAPLFERLTYTIPGMHIKAHEENCQKCFTRDYLPGTGKCDAEGSERIWSELNQWAGSLSEMNPGHRHDILNDNVNDWNWRKLLSLGQYLVDRLLLAKKNKLEFMIEFQELCATTSPLLNSQWELLSPQVQVSANGKEVKSVYFNDTNKVPTLAVIRRTIAEEERQRSETWSPNDGIINSRTELVDILRFALELEQSQANTLRYVKVHPMASRTDEQITTLQTMRRSISSRLELWQRFQKLYICPSFCDYRQHAEEPENAMLNLPSSFDVEERSNHGLTEIAAVECKLRQIFAFQALNDLKHAIMMKLATLTARRTHVSGQRQATRAAQIINKQAANVEIHGSTYTRHRNAMLALGMGPADAVFKELKKEDCTLKNYPTESTSGKRTKTQHEVSWIWRIGAQVTMGDDSEWFTEVQKTQWFLCRAQKERWIEEVEILEEEMRRLLRFFQCFYQIWLKVAERYADEPATQSYAVRMAMMYNGLYEDAVSRFDPELVNSVSSSVVRQ